MADAPRDQSHRAKAAPPQTQQVAKPAVRHQVQPSAQPIALPQSVGAQATQKDSALQMEEAVVTLGRGGEKNITLEKFWVEVDGHLPAGFNVATRDGHGLEVIMEQTLYRRAYAGTSTLKTGLMPIAPIETKGRIVVTDTTTGETLEQPWTWFLLRRSSSLWQLIKRLIWKG